MKTTGRSDNSGNPLHQLDAVDIEQHWVEQDQLWLPRSR